MGSIRTGTQNETRHLQNISHGFELGFGGTNTIVKIFQVIDQL